MYEVVELTPEEQIYGRFKDNIRKVLYNPDSKEDWLAARKTGIGGSDVGTLMGLNPYSSALQVYKSKDPDYKAPDPTTNMRKGTELEDFVLTHYVIPEYFAKGFTVHKPKLMFCRSETPYLHASLDGWASNTDRNEYEIVEIKYVSEWGSAAWDTREYGGVPASYYAQVQAYMWTLDVQKAVIYALFDQTWTVKRYTVERNDFFITEMLDVVSQFWKTNMGMHIPPKPSLVGEKPDFAEVFETLMSDPEFASLKEDDPEMVSLCDSIAKDKQALKVLEERIMFSTDRLGELALEGKQCSRFHVSTYSVNRIDTEKLKKEYPEVAAACTKQSASTRTTIK